MPETAQEYDIVIETCSDICTKKMHDYGTVSYTHLTLPTTRLV